MAMLAVMLQILVLFSLINRSWESLILLMFLKKLGESKVFVKFEISFMLMIISKK